jgi:hypothetical protein
MGGTFKGRKVGRVESLDDYRAFGDDVDFDHEEPNVVTSRFGLDGMEDWHMPVLDIDFPAHLEPSTTEGHFHLYLDRAMEQDSLFKLMDVMCEVGLLEPGYVAAAKIRGYSSCRLPWVRKPESPAPAPAVEQGRIF